MVEVSIVPIGVVVVVGLIMGAVFNKLRLGSTVGYIITGVLLGPLMLHFLSPADLLVGVFGEIGVLLLLFFLGLELSWGNLVKGGAPTAVMAFLQMAIAFVLAFSAAKLFGFSDIDAIVIGTFLPMASTAVIARFILEKNLEETEAGRFSITALVIEDFAGIVVLVLMNSLLTGNSSLPYLANSLVFVVALFYLVRKLSVFALGILQRFGQADKMALFGIGVGIVVALFGETFLGISSALGAYFAGFALSETQYAHRIKREVGFFREFFLLFFFVFFGASVFVFNGVASIPPMAELVNALALVGVLVVLNLVANIVGFGVMATLMGMHPANALRISLLMSLGVGEFAVLIAVLAHQLLPGGGLLLSIAFMLMLATTIVGHLLYGAADRLAPLFAKLFPKSMYRVAHALHSRTASLQQPFVSRKESDVSTSLHALGTHLSVILSVVYLLSIVRIEFQIPFLEFIPANASLTLVALPLLVWPIYRVVKELKYLVEKATDSMAFAFFPSLKRKLTIERQVADIFTGVVLVLVGILASVLVYSRLEAVFLIAPIAFTLVSIMYLSRSLYAVFEGYESVSGMVGSNDAHLTKASREFDSHARVFRTLHLERSKTKEAIQEAVNSGNRKRALGILNAFRRKEQRLLSGYEPTVAGEYRHPKVESAHFKESFRKHSLRFRSPANKKKR